MNGRTLTANSSDDDVSAAGFKKSDVLMKATTGSVKALCTFNDFAVPGQRQAGLIGISCSKAENADKASNIPENNSAAKEDRFQDLLLESYMKDLKSGSEDQQIRAAKEFATQGDKARSALPSLNDLLTSPNPTVRSAAKAAIASIKRGDASGDNSREKVARRESGKPKAEEMDKEASTSESDSPQSALRERIIKKICEVSIAHAVEQRGKLVIAQARVSALSGNAGMGPMYSPNRPAMLMQLESLIRRKTNGVTDQSQFELLVKATAQSWMTEYLTAPIGRGVVE